MKYTRYNIKSNKKDKFLFSFIVISILIIAFLIGTIISNVFIKKDGTTLVDLKKVPTAQSGKNNNVFVKESTAEKYVLIQFGMFKNKNYADELKTQLASKQNVYYIQDGDKIRVVDGIFTQESGEKIIKELNNKKLQNSKMTLQIEKKDLCNTEIAEMVNAYISILDKLSEKNIKGIQTEQLKKWIKNIKIPNNDSKNYTTFIELKNNINNMPQKLTKSNIQMSYQFLYKILKEVK